jgi:hypothetical protein
MSAAANSSAAGAATAGSQEGTAANSPGLLGKLLNRLKFSPPERVGEDATSAAKPTVNMPKNDSCMSFTSEYLGNGSEYFDYADGSEPSELGTPRTPEPPKMRRNENSFGSFGSVTL